MTARPKTKTNIRKNQWLRGIQTAIIPNVYSALSITLFLWKGPGMIHPPAGPISSRIREGKEEEEEEEEEEKNMREEIIRE